MPPKRKAAASTSRRGPGRAAKAVRTEDSTDVTDSVPVKEEPDEEYENLGRVRPLPAGARGLLSSRWAKSAEPKQDAPPDATNGPELTTTIAQEEDLIQLESPRVSLVPLPPAKMEPDVEQTEQSPPSPPPPTIDIAPDGDVVLVVGPEATKFRVYSQVLKISSKNFVQLLSPPMPAEITLPHDDAEAIDIILQVLHHRRDIMSDGLNAKLVLRSAIAADKIDCKEALSLTLNLWLNNNLDYKTLGSAEAFMLLEAMYWLENEEAFRSFSIHLILNHQGPYFDLWPFKSEHIKTDVVVRILRTLDDHRDRIRRHLVRLALDNPNVPNLTRLPTCSKDCVWVSSCRESWKHRVLASKVLERILDCSVTGVLQIAAKIQEPAALPSPNCKGPKPTSYRTAKSSTR